VGHTIKRCKKPVEAESNGFDNNDGGFSNEAPGGGGGDSWGNNDGADAGPADADGW
jgi:hypothetical protein